MCSKYAKSNPAYQRGSNLRHLTGCCTVRAVVYCTEWRQEGYPGGPWTSLIAPCSCCCTEDYCKVISRALSCTLQ